MYLVRKAIIFLLVLPGCATIDSLDSKEGTSFSVYDRDYQEVWQASMKAVSKYLEIVTSNEEQGVIKAKGGVEMLSGPGNTWGDLVGVYITPSAEGHDVYNVEVVSVTKSKVQLTGKRKWEPILTDEIRWALGM